MNACTVKPVMRAHLSLHDRCAPVSSFKYLNIKSIGHYYVCYN